MLLPYGEVRPCKGHEIIQSRKLKKKLGKSEKNHGGIKALVEGIGGR